MKGREQGTGNREQVARHHIGVCSTTNAVILSEANPSRSEGRAEPKDLRLLFRKSLVLAGIGGLLRKNVSIPRPIRAAIGGIALKGHDFSRAVRAQEKGAALAAGGMRAPGKTLPQGLKPRASNRPYSGTTKVVPFQNRVHGITARAAAISTPCPILSRTLRKGGRPALQRTPCPILSRTLRKGGRPFALAGIACLVFLAGCRQDMQDQPKMQPQRGSDFFADHRGARPQVLDTVARGQLHEDSYFYTGVVQGPNGYRQELDSLPSEIPLTMEVLERGQERFNIYCTPCHSRVGNGLGEIVQRGFKPAANFHDQVRLSQPISHYFYVMTHGYGAMPDYSAQLTPSDRWAVAAYIRALQLSEAATIKDVPAGVQIRSLKDVATAEGHPEYAAPWPMPSTAVQANKPIASQGAPGMAPAYPADPKISIPRTALPAAGKK